MSEVHRYIWLQGGVFLYLYFHSKLEDHLISAVSDYLFNASVTILHELATRD
jgi:hypothetical protein